MPPRGKIQREAILKTSLEIVRENGIEKLNARTLAKRLNCSTQPIFYQFKNMEELKSAVFESALEIFRTYMLEIPKDSYRYKEMGKNYIKFAKNEPQLFQLIFMHNTNLSPEEFMCNEKSYMDIATEIAKQTNLSQDQIKKFHLKMWIFTNGIACLVANHTCHFTDDQIDHLLTEEYQALLKLEHSNQQKE